MNYQYEIEKTRLHGIEMYYATLRYFGKVIATTSRFSEADAKAWAIQTHQKIINRLRG